MSETESKQRVIRFAPLTTAPKQVDPTAIACSIEDYNLLINLGFTLLHGSMSLVTFTKKCSVGDHETCQINIRYEKETWTCAIVMNWNKNENVYDAYFSAKHKTLKELMTRVNLTFKTTHELMESLSITD